MSDKFKRTKKSFGYQWTRFSQMPCDFRENFLNYINPIRQDFFEGKMGLDAGCGFGRHIYNAALFGADMIGVDISRAIYSAKKNTQSLKNVNLIQADIYNLPFKDGVFDFAYSIGVLHHLVEPEEGFQKMVAKVKRGGTVFIWVYSDKRKIINYILEKVRIVTYRLPFSILMWLCFILALIDFYFFILPYKQFNKWQILKKFRIERLDNYSVYPFQVSYADWFDRLSAPIRFYYKEQQISDWFKRAGLRNIKITATGNYGLRGYGEKL